MGVTTVVRKWVAYKEKERDSCHVHPSVLLLLAPFAKKGMKTPKTTWSGKERRQRHIYAPATTGFDYIITVI